MLSVIRFASAYDVAMPCLGAGSPAVGEHAAEGAALLGEVDRLGLGADDLDARRRRAPAPAPAASGRRAGSMTPGDRAGLLLGVDDLEHVLQRERLEVEPVGGVVVGGDGLGVAVDHDRLVAGLAQRQLACTQSSRTRCPGRSGWGRCRG